MKTLFITAYPFAIQTGYLEVPDEMSSGQYDEYVREHWGEIEFLSPDLDYANAEVDVEEYE